MTVKTKDSFRVSMGGAFATVSKSAHWRNGKQVWRVRWEDAGKWRSCHAKTRTEAVAKAENLLKQRGTGLVWDALDGETKRFLEDVHKTTSPADRRVLLDFIKSRKSSDALDTSVADFMAFKIVEKGRETEHLEMVRRDLESLGESFKGRLVSDVNLGDLSKWWDERTGTAGVDRKKAIRGTLVMFWRWCRKMGISSNDAVTVAERLPGVTGKHGSKQVLEPEIFQKIACALLPEYRAWAVLGYFAGLRPEEIAPKVANPKDRIKGEDIDWKFGVIRISESVAKTGASRIIPMNAACKAWLKWAGVNEKTVGNICKRNISDMEETKRVGLLVFDDGKWPRNALRHSYGSYRNALLRNLDQVAEEMGTSVAMMRRNYHNPRSKAEGKAWEDCRPEKGISKKVAKR